MPEHPSELVSFFQPPYFSHISERKAEIPAAQGTKRCISMNLEEMAGILKSSLGLNDNVVGVRLFKNESEIPKELGPMD